MMNKYIAMLILHWLRSAPRLAWRLTNLETWENPTPVIEAIYHGLEFPVWAGSVIEDDSDPAVIFHEAIMLVKSVLDKVKGNDF